MHPYVFQGTGFETASWDFLVLSGFVVSLSIFFIMRCRSDYSPVTPAGIICFSILLLITGSLGAKFLYMILHRETLFKAMGLSFGDAFASSGYAFMGALVFELITIAAFAKIRPRPISALAFGDVVLPFIFLHQFFTRIGCFMSGCCYGPQTSMPWGVVFAGEVVRRHPTQLYFAAMCLVIFFVGDRIYKKRLPKGVVFFATLSVYGALRCVLESWRVDSPHVLGPVTLAQIATFLLASVSGICLYMVLARNGLIKPGRKT